MNRTPIEWVKNPDGTHTEKDLKEFLRRYPGVKNPGDTQGYTWNPITGCLNGCEYCYARRLANTRLRDTYLANDNLAPLIGEGIIPYHTARMLDAINPFYPRFWPEKLEQPLKCKKPAGIFCCDMSDLFGIGVPVQWTEQVMATIKACPQHRFYLLTKQPQNLVKFSPFPDNCWVGVSATDWLMFSDALGHLATIQAKIKYISFEPLLERIQFDMLQEMLFPRVIQWAIIGAQTKPTVMPEVQWVEDIIEACGKANIPYFLKDNLRPIAKLIARFCGPEDWELKQEMPVG